ncbi:hypothetical protein HYPSUDRAFT_123415, partial [Hypholoma sublateritium FD-334 SS-4]
FQVIRTIHNVAQLSGRATHVWLVRRKGKYYVLKDSWPLQSKPFSEIRHLLKINQTILKDPVMRKKLKHKYPVLIVGQEFEDNTGFFRAELGAKIFPRVHRRIVTKPIGDPLTSFNSKFEFCKILCDVVEYLKYSSKDCFVCHGDISLKNIPIGIPYKTTSPNANSLTEPQTTSDVSSPTAAPTTPDVISPAVSTSCDVPVPISAHGLVIDNDNSSVILYLIVCQGTVPFMALESLQWEDTADFTHEPRHDLESLFYVILTICTYVDSPGCLRSAIPDEDERSLCLNEWWATLDGNLLARNKASHMTSLEHCVLRRLPPYWHDFHKYLIEL